MKVRFFPLLLLQLLCFFTLVSAQESVIKLSEVMFTPSESNSEYIEIFNISDSINFDITNLKIKYHTASPDLIVSPNGDSLLKPGGYGVIFEGDYNFEAGIYKDIIDSNALILIIDNNAFGSSGMANSSDRNIILLNELNDTLETYTYSSDNSAGYSDEKIDLIKNNDGTNWLNSITKNGTPGGKNSVSPKTFDLKIEEYKDLSCPAITF